MIDRSSEDSIYPNEKLDSRQAGRRNFNKYWLSISSRWPGRAVSPSSDLGDDLVNKVILVGDKKFDIGKLAKIAARERKNVFFAYLTNSILMLGSCFLLGLTIALASGVISYRGIILGAEDRLVLLLVTGRFLFAGIFCAWFYFVFLDGWLFYPPSRPIDGKRGTTRAWYDAITFMVNEEPAEVSDGLTNALNRSLRSKIRAAILFLWGSLGLFSSFALITVSVVNLLFSAGFSAALQSEASESLQFMQTLLVYVVTFGSNLTDFGDANPKLSLALSLGLFYVLPLAALYYSSELIKNSFDMRWSLLSTPDILYKMLKNVLLVRNDSRDYNLEDAVRDAREFVFEYGVEKHPEDFIDMEGNLFFYSNNMRREFLKGTTHKDASREVK